MKAFEIHLHRPPHPPQRAKPSPRSAFQSADSAPPVKGEHEKRKPAVCALRACVRANAPSPCRCSTLPRGGDREQRLSIGCNDEVGSFLKNMGMKSSKVPLFLTRYHEFEKSQVFLRFRLGLFALFSLSLPRKHAPSLTPSPSFPVPH